MTSGSFDTNGRSETFATLSLQGTGIGNAGALVNSAAGFSAITPTGGTTLTGNATIGVTQSTGVLQLNNAIGGNFALTKTGSGTLLLAGNNTFTGGVMINGGTLQVGNPGALNSSSPNSVAFSSNSSGALSLNGASVTVSGLTTSAIVGTPVVQNGNVAPATLTVNTSAANTFAGTLQDGLGGGSLGLTVSGSGTLTLSGNNAFSGGMTINAGTVTLSGNNSLTGGVTINAGTLQIGSGANAGTLNANGNITIDGGVLQRDSSSTLALAAADTMTIQNGGRASFTGDYTTATSAIYNIGGTNSTLETLGGGALNLNNGAQMNITASGLLSISGNLEVGNGTSGTLSANGTNSNITQSGAGTLTVGHATTGTAAVNIGTTASGGTLTTGSGLFTINKTGTISIGSATTTGALNADGDVTIDGGVLQVYAGNFNLAASKTFTVQNGGSATFTGVYTTAAEAIYNIIGTNSIWQTGLAMVQNHSTVNVGTTVSGGTFNASLSIDGTSSVNIGSATTTGSLVTDIVTVDGGVLQVLNPGSTFTLARSSRSSIHHRAKRRPINLAQSFSAVNFSTCTVTGTNSIWEFVDGSGLTIGGSTQLNIASGGSLSVSGDVTVIAGSTLTINSGGSVTANGLFTCTSFGSIVNIGSATTTGTLNVGQLKIDSEVNLNFINGTLGITGAGGLSLGSTTLGTNFSLVPNRTLNVTNATTIPVGASLALDGGTLNTASMVVNGAFDFSSGTLGITGPAGLAVGAGGLFGSTAVFNANQTLHVTNTLNVNSGAYLAVAGGFSAGNLVNNGDLVVINTAIGGPVVNNSAVTVVGSVDFNGLVSGPGNFFGPGTAHFNGGLAPGASPAQVSFEGSLALANTNTLFIDIGGTTPGNGPNNHDQVNVAGSATLDGTLDLVPYNGFVPVSGDKFTVMTYASATGTFSSVVGTTPAPGLTYTPVYLPTSLVIITTRDGERTWGTDSDGNWSVAGNWLGGVAPGGVGDSVTFSTIITANRTVTLDADTTIGTLAFDSPNNYTIAGTNMLTLQATGTIAAAISISGTHGNGAHTISTPITLASDLNITQNSSGVFTISGPLNNAAGKQINVSGSGTTAITGSINLGDTTSISASGTSTLRFGLSLAHATIGTGVTAAVNNSATLELAGTVSALSSGSNRVNIVNNSTSAVGILVSGTHQQLSATSTAQARRKSTRAAISRPITSFKAR